MNSVSSPSQSAVRGRAADLLGLGVALVATFAVATFGAQFEPGTWYRQLARPTWTPPGWIFGPVWTYLYLTMAIAAWLVWRSAAWRAVRPAILLYAGQLLLNGLWSWLFFGKQMIGAALLDIVALLMLIVLTALAFRRHRRIAFRLLVPYIAWVTFASCLNFAIWLKN